jgi:hypothetical protein
MKTFNRSVLAVSLLTGLSILISSFSLKKGGDSFEIYVNGRLVVQQYVAVAKGIQNLQLGENFSNGKIEVYYSHCGHTGTGRSITIRNAQNKVLKQWQFANVQTKSPMTCQVKDILALQKNKDAQLNLYYSSKELPEGRLLASITNVSEKTASAR